MPWLSSWSGELSGRFDRTTTSDGPRSRGSTTAVPFPLLRTGSTDPTVAVRAGGPAGAPARIRPPREARARPRVHARIHDDIPAAALQTVVADDAQHLHPVQQPRPGDELPRPGKATGPP